MYLEVNTPSADLRKSFHAPDDAVKPRIPVFSPTWALYASVFVAWMLPFQFGWSISQVNLSTFANQDDCDARPVVEGTCLMFPGHTKTEWIFVVNAWIVGGMIGSLSCGSLADKYGRRKVLLTTSLFMIVGGAIQASASALAVFVVGRLIAGIASGFATGLVGGYINEIAPPHLRNTLGIGLQTSLSTGILLVVCTFFFANTNSGWRYIAGFPIVWGAVFLALASFVLVESPAWLLTKGRRDEASRVMARIYGDEHVGLAFLWFEPHASVSDIETPRAGSEDHEGGQSVELESESTLSQLISPLYRRQLIVAIGVAAAQQLSGVNAVFYYSSSFFQDAGISDDRIGSVIVNTMNLVPTFFVGHLANRYGNRKLLLVGLTGMIVSAVGMTVALVTGVSALSIVFTAAYVGFFAMSLGPLIYVVTADLFPDAVRASACSICIFFNYLSNLVVGVSFPYIADGLDDLSFLPFIATLSFFLCFTLKLVPETSGKTSDEIQAEFRLLREKSAPSPVTSPNSQAH
uniref:Hexose transporter 1 n=1 Tax=Globisporangium ultimum (strain ATCC 200006 / CBS 805.95 / DAOM BR144) TaxID=431595 RepID=K3W631_GLOUD